MANIGRYSPFRPLERVSPFSDVERMFENLLRPLTGGQQQALGDIRLDVSEDANAYTVRADMPGVSKDDIKVSIDGNQVSIATEIKQETEDKSGNMLCRERFCGQQFRSFTLDTPVDEDKANAKYENGVLELTLPKKPGATKRQLQIS